MKYFAILKDSLREAIDTKVFYAMLAMSLVLILLVASIGFQPVEATEALPALVKDFQFRMVSADRGRNPSAAAKTFLQAQLAVTSIKQLTEATQPNARDYSFTLTMDDMNPYAVEEAVDYWSKPTPEVEGFHGRGKFQVGGQHPAGPLVSDNLLEEFVAQHFASMADLTVEKVTVKVLERPSNDGKNFKQGKYQFDVQTKGRASTKAWPHDISLFFGLIDPQDGPFRSSASNWVYIIENVIINGIGGWVTLLVGVVITSFFIPNMLRKGTIDMLLAKPLHRPVLLVYKYIGGLTFVFLSSCVAIGGVWVVFGLRAGLWTPGFLLTILTLTFFFAILYSISTLFAVLTRSPIVSILVTCIVWFFLWVVGQAHAFVNGVVLKDPAMARMKEEMPGWIYTTIDVVHFILPRTSDLNVLNAHLVGSVLTDNERVQHGFFIFPDVAWTESIAVSLVFIAVMLALACWRLSRKDF